MPSPTRPRKPSKSPKKLSYHHGDLRRALLDAGLALIEEHGAQGFTLREAARRAGVSQAAPYRHFVDKNALLAAIAEEGFRALTARMRAEVAASGAPPGAMEPIGMGYLLFAAENPAHYRVMFGPGVAHDTLSPSASEAGVESFQMLVDGVAAAQRAGLVRAGDVQALALFSWSVVHGFALLVIDGRVEIPRPRPGDRDGADAVAFRQLAATVLQLSVEGTAAR